MSAKPSRAKLSPEKQRIELLEKKRAAAIFAMKSLEETPCGAVAMDDMRTLFVNRQGAPCLDVVMKKQLKTVFDALLLGIRDGIV